MQARRPPTGFAVFDSVKTPAVHMYVFASEGRHVGHPSLQVKMAVQSLSLFEGNGRHRAGSSSRQARGAGHQGTIEVLDGEGEGTTFFEVRILAYEQPRTGRRMNPPRKVGARSPLPGFRIDRSEFPFHTLS